MSLSHDDVLRILALLDASDFDELRLETSDYKLHVRRSGAAATEEPARAGGATALPTGSGGTDLPTPKADSTPTPAAATLALSPSPHSTAAAPALATPASTSLADVRTPLLGTFYRSPQPGAAPFVELGSPVDDDTVIGIVEVMKLMSSISAGTKGVVAEILAKDGALVEYDEVLMRIALASA